ncbi:MAG: hypothetical protein KJ051_13660 [Thermoleophilia bacterium]|nr:hypothetical protein [Thermoleophilia bacterium]
MRRLRALIRREDGIALVLVVSLYALLILLAVTLLATVQGEASRSEQGLKRGTAFQAAEAGVDDFLAKLVDDPSYYSHYVHPGEATREEPGGAQAPAGSVWGYDLAWTYPNGNDTWRPLTNGYEYSLRIAPPSAGSKVIQVIATGRKSGTTTGSRTVEALVRPSSLADFYRVVNGNVSWGSGATTNGKIYANGNIDHDGIATANMYAEGSVTGSYTLQNGAEVYNSSTIRTVIKNPINFSDFLTSFVDIQRASQLGGVYLNDPTKAGWKLVFQSGGTVSIQSCQQTGGRDVADAAPTCSGSTTLAVPSNGAIYSAQTAIVSGQVNGRVTVASNDDIVIAGDITYLSANDDVLGLAAQNDVVIARYVPYNLTWYASVLAQTGTWRTFTADGSHGTMTFRGSAATNLGGGMTMFQARDYGYRDELQFLPPPWFPTIEEAYTVALFRELPSSQGGG